MVYVGIDFGTCTTVAAQCTGQTPPSVIASAEGDHVVPSAVAFPPSGRMLVGRAAHARRLIDPRNTLHAVKRVLGRRWGSAEVTKFRAQYPFELTRGEDELPRFGTRAGVLDAVQVVSHMFESVAAYPELANRRPEVVTITVPNSADEAQRQATVKAAQQAGFANILLLDEAQAAFLGSGMTLRPGEKVVVFDLGGGTCDVTVLEGTSGAVRVLAVCGDAYLGGDDVDHALVAHVVQRILEDYRWDVRTNAASLERLSLTCEDAKHTLSTLREATLALDTVDSVLGGKILHVQREVLERLCLDVVRRSFLLCDEVLHSAGVRASEIDHVLLSGGATYMPVIRSGIETYFGRSPQRSMQPDRLVALGAARYARSRA